MTRSPEYENLIKTKAFEAVAPTPGAVAGFLRNAQDYLETAQAMDPARERTRSPASPTSDRCAETTSYTVTRTCSGTPS